MRFQYSTRSRRLPSVIVICPVCNQPFSAWPSRLRKTPDLACSQECYKNRRYMPWVDRFWSHVDRSGGPDACWLWMIGLQANGYGRITIDGAGHRAHRVAWQLTNGPIPDGMIVCHSCDVRYPIGDITYRRCCNPAHLWLGTNAANSQDASYKGRLATGERHASRLHPNCMARGDHNGSRLYPERLHRGERHHGAKLTDEQVIEMRSLYAAGGIAFTALGQKFGVAEVTARSAVRRETWQHLP